MSETTLDRYLTKTEYYERFKRHNRTLTGDINNAFKLNNLEVLSLCQLRTKNGDVYEAVDIDADYWKKLDKEGEAPYWVLHPDLDQIISKFKRSGRKRNSANGPQPDTDTIEVEKQTETAEDVSSKTSDLALPTDPQVKAVVLEHLHHNNQRHEKEHKQLTDRVLGLVETNQELQKQTNSLMNTLQELIRERGLGSGNFQQLNSAKEQKRQQEPLIEVVDATVTDAPASKPPKTTASARPVNKSKRKRTSKKARKTVGSTTPAKRKPNKSKSLWNRDITSFFTRS